MSERTAALPWRKNGITLVTAAFGAMITGVILIANRGFDEWVLDLFRSIPNLDKVLHFLLFGTMAFLLSMALKARMVSIASRSVLWGVLIVAAFCVVEEFSQIWIPTRTFSFMDLAADMVGITLASWLIKRRGAQWLSKKEVIPQKG